jgi:hypothetical protein
MDRDVVWFEMPVHQQICNIGSEVRRAIKWKNKDSHEKKENFCAKAVELLERSKRDPRNSHRVIELMYCQELLIDFLLGSNVYGSSDELLMKYYDQFIDCM